ncbi:MAG: ComEA family DNA-binding protein [Anaerolineaceae bacterium]|jgi:competence ComEA-like helix-hairpin-helix protein
MKPWQKVVIGVLVCLVVVGIVLSLVLPGRGPTPILVAVTPTLQVSSQKTAAVHLLNLNTATFEELLSLPGIGEVKASRILALREKLGCFTRIEELMEVEGIGEGTFEILKPLVTIDP